jgi:hypothetical protein
MIAVIVPPRSVEVRAQLPSGHLDRAPHPPPPLKDGDLHLPECRIVVDESHHPNAAEVQALPAEHVKCRRSHRGFDRP